MTGKSQGSPLPSLHSEDEIRSVCQNVSRHQRDFTGLNDQITLRNLTHDCQTIFHGVITGNFSLSTSQEAFRPLGTGCLLLLHHKS